MISYLENERFAEELVEEEEGDVDCGAIVGASSGFVCGAIVCFSPRHLLQVEPLERFAPQVMQ